MRHRLTPGADITGAESRRGAHLASHIGALPPVLTEHRAYYSLYLFIVVVVSQKGGELISKAIFFLRAQIVHRKLFTENCNCRAGPRMIGSVSACERDGFGEEGGGREARCILNDAW